jgi:hypothetical protein
MHGATLCVVQANHGFATIDFPVSQGSIRIEYAPFADLRSDAEGLTSGENMRRKLASAFKCLTVNDMVDHGRDRYSTLRPSSSALIFGFVIDADGEFFV